ncbi:MAG: EAL domain-containing protein [Sphingomonadaceae bacterium]|nr:EAL domain-containing protein [Sphingomonadaceae bacterium]
MPYRREADVVSPAHRIEERHAPAGQVRNAQIAILARFSHYTAITSTICAALMAFMMWPSMSPVVLVGWLAAVASASYASSRWLARTSLVRTGDSIPESAIWIATADAGLRAVLWVALPIGASLTGYPVSAELGGALAAAMIVTGVALAVIPFAASIWSVVIASGFLIAIALGAEPVAPVTFMVIAFVATVAMMGFLLLADQWRAQVDRAAVLAAKRADIGLLLKEYEDRGAGWLWQVDAQHCLTYVSPRLGELLGQGTYALIGQSLPLALGGRGKLGEVLVARDRFTRLEMEVATDAGTRWISLAGSPTYGDDGAFEGFRGVGLDITENKNSHERLQYLANLDVLTSLPNRSRVRKLLDAALVESRTSGVPCAILFLDLDGFKPVNDTFGHPKGDAVLKTVAKRLSDAVGAQGHVGRIGGDEFGVIVNDAQSRLRVEELARRLIGAIGDPYLIDNTQIRVGLSIGAAFGPIDGETVDDLIRKADLALYHAKAQGRGTYCAFNPEMQNQAEERVRLEGDLRQAIGTAQLQLAYQPLVCARTQRVTGFEALLRWKHPVRGPISPAVFIPIAEESGLIAEIGEWVMRKACDDASSWPEDVSVSVNVSPLQLIVPALPNAVSDALAKARIQANRLEIEVTESVFMANAGNAVDVLKRLRGLGVGIALDDFGTGYSSLGYLNKAVFHKLKIDGSFVREAGERAETVSIIKAIVMLANSFRLTITAEGVETADDFNRMRDLGCHQLQGYLFGRPLPFEKTLEIVGTRWDHRQVG